LLAFVAEPAQGEAQGELSVESIEPEAPLPASIVRVHIGLENRSGRTWKATERLAYAWNGGPQRSQALEDPIRPGERRSRILVIPTPARPGPTKLGLRLPAIGAVVEVPVAPTGVYVDGRGNGHGLGMSQWGARARGEAGADYRAILAAYYTGALVESRDTDFPVRVALHHGPIDLRGGWPPLFGAGPRVWGPAHAADVGDLGPLDFLEWFVQDGRLAVRLLRAGREATVINRGQLEVAATDPAFGLRTNLQQTMDYGFQPLGEERRYRGSLRVLPAGPTSYQVVNVLAFEDYLKGVVPAEMPAFWHGQALRAQAVAARTYALRKIRAGGRGSFDVEATEFDQVYGGITVERPPSSEAVQATRGEVLTYSGGLVDALFMSSGGGHTEHSENGFVRWDGGVIHAAVIPYLRGVSDPLDPYPAWRVGPYAPEDAATLLRDRGVDVGGRLRAIEPLDRGASGRVLAARLVGDRAAVTVSGPRLRYALGLRDTLIDVHGP